MALRRVLLGIIHLKKEDKWNGYPDEGKIVGESL